MIAALYVDAKHGPYPALGVDCWGLDRDATRYGGPGPVIAHPPCGPWGRYHQKSHEDPGLAVTAVSQVRRFGGVLEHPKDSKLWAACGMPPPGHFPDEWGGWTILVRQIDWGHRAEKPTWLYLVGCRVPPMPPKQPSPPPPPPFRSGRQPRGVLEVLSKKQRRLTPPAFAAWLVDLVS